MKSGHRDKLFDMLLASEQKKNFVDIWPKFLVLEQKICIILLLFLMLIFPYFQRSVIF